MECECVCACWYACTGTSTRETLTQKRESPILIAIPLLIWQTPFIIHLITESRENKARHFRPYKYRHRRQAAKCCGTFATFSSERVAKIFCKMTRSHVLDLATLALVNLLARWLMAKTNSLFVTERHLRLAQDLMKLSQSFCYNKSVGVSLRWLRWRPWRPIQKSVNL